MPASTFREPGREIAYVSMLRAQRARAMLLIGSGFQDPSWERELAAELTPYTRAGGRVAVVSRHRSLRVDTVLPENHAGAAAPARALLRLGHRDFAALTGPQPLTTVADRLAEFRETLAEAGVDLPRERVVRGDVCGARPAERGVRSETCRASVQNDACRTRPAERHPERCEVPPLACSARVARPNRWARWPRQFATPASHAR
ncbi:hypothetical protein AB0B50_06755 [Streptomyces sp. NPDC041068]|uniref:hypothetical protein n=1 Tax=Streptomyces sp. NPDC041068 TaxID=3155130 RepID=UPI0033CA24B0